ncbi:MAG: type II secretion system protein [Ruthenibacterium sp.]
MNKANKRGITLIELICVLAVVAILGPLIGGFITTAGAQYNNAALHTRAKSNVTMLQEFCESELRLATAAEIKAEFSYEPPTATSKILYANGNNGFVYNDLNVPYLGQDSDIYKGIRYGIHFTAEPDGSLTIVITAYAEKNATPDTTKKLYSATSTIKLLNATVAQTNEHAWLWYQPAHAK